ncbi:MAG: carboxypeptidase regulatory-like domain-containing protein [Planctomycetota bacterium]|nr:carboxypeptidase regulatory-like domain-containing protein [Planctomycetota bacterium]
MQQRSTALTLGLILILGMLGYAFWPAEKAQPPGPSATAETNQNGVEVANGKVAADLALAQAADARLAVSSRGSDRGTGVRGVVVDARTGMPLAAIEVRALKEEPSIAPLMNRFRGLIQGGMFTDTQRPPQVLGVTESRADGTFELTGLPTGRVFLDARSDAWFVRTPGTARLGLGEMVEGIELRVQPGGRVRGIVLGADGAPVPMASVSLRPGLNAFLGQLTERKLRWLQVITDKDGRFDIPGVPAGNGYVATAAAPSFALEEQYGVEVREAQVTELTLRGHAGATVAGMVLDGKGAPLAGASIAMIYLDVSRVLLSADGRSEPITSGADGKFSVRPVSAGRVAFVAAADGLAPSNIVDLAVVDGGSYDDLFLRLSDGATVVGKVVDELSQPVAAAKVELRPFESPKDPEFLKMMLKVRHVEVETGADGSFVAKGMTGEGLIVEASKAGYTTGVRWGVKLDEKDLVVQVQRGAIVRGIVQIDGGKPCVRFRVSATTKPAKDPKDAAVAKDGKKPVDAAAASATSPDAMSGPSWSGGGRVGRGTKGSTGTQLPEGQTMAGRGMDMEANWREIAAEDGSFELRGLPPGRITVRVRADGFLDPASQEMELQAGQAGDVLKFTIAPGVAASGVVIDAATNRPVSDAQVTAYRARDGQQKRGGMFGDIDGEDFDFLAMSSMDGRRSAVTDSQGRFRIESLTAGKYRFTARHPDKAKASAKEIEVLAEKPPTNIEIKLDDGGGIEGNATGFGLRPLADAAIATFSLQTGTLRSSTTDKGGYFRIEGLPPGQYIVFKSRIDERADNIPLELLSNLRLKSTTVRQGKLARVDVHDEGEDGVRVYGIVREGGKPVARALVTLLGSDREGILGMGVRASAADLTGRYELVGIKPGNYIAQISRFQGRPMQTSFELEVPSEQRDFLFDIELPTSEVAGRVVDSRGNPVPGIQLSLGSVDGGLIGAEGLVGMIAQGGLNQGRSDDNGEFRLRSVAAGTYRLRAGSRAGGGFGGGGQNGGERNTKYGEGGLDGLAVDGRSKTEGLVITVPLAASIKGIVLDGSSAPVRGAEIHYAETSAKQQRSEKNLLTSMLGMQARPITTGEDGRFEILGLNPGSYDLRVETEALQAGRAQDIVVAEDGMAEVTLRIVRGATVKVRATNVDKQSIPIASVSLLDGKGRKVVNKISTVSVMRRLMSSRDEVKDSGWYEFGSVPPDTYTIVIAEAGKEETRITRTVVDGELVEWDIDVAAELRARDTKK